MLYSKTSIMVGEACSLDGQIGRTRNAYTILVRKLLLEKSSAGEIALRWILLKYTSSVRIVAQDHVVCWAVVLLILILCVAVLEDWLI
jgi:hypothetical protein